MSITKIKFGEINGKDVYLFTLDNGNGLCAEITNYGGIVRTLVYKGIDVVLGRDSLEEYLNNNGFFGALIGRNSNRIEGAKVTLSGKEYILCANDGRNNLHSGNNGFDKRVWDVKAIDSDEPQLELYLISPDGDEGFPGEVAVNVIYTLTKDNGLRICYDGVADRDTVFNMTNHSYFNLNGHNSGTIDCHKLTMNAEFYTPNTEECMPYGEILSVKRTAFDFTEKKALVDAFKSDEKQITMFGGLDHNFVLSGTGYRKVAVLEGDITGIKMEVYTDRPGVQIYTGNNIECDRICKGGAEYEKHSAICLETQAFSNSLKYPFYPNGILKKDEAFKSVTEYKFI